MSSASDQLIYLDCNATTPVMPQIASAVMHSMEVCFGNPSSSHITGLKARRLMEQTRDMGKQIIGAPKGRLLFTSGATEGIQTSIVSALIEAKKWAIENPVLLYGATEHKAVPNTLKHWNDVLNVGAQIIAIPVDEKGLLDLTFIEKHISRSLLVCTMIVNNETGVAQDIAKLERAIKTPQSRAFWMVDCVQGLGKQNLDLDNTKVDYAPFSGHKLYAPKGIGFLYLDENAPLTPFIAGGGQEGGARSGTENLPGIAGLNELFRLMLEESGSVFKPVAKLSEFREQLAIAIQDTFGDVVFNNDFTVSVPTTLNFSVANMFGSEVMNLFDSVGIRVSAGSACSSGAASSFVLDAMNLPNWQSENAIRLSFGPAASSDEIQLACDKIRSLKLRLQNHCMLGRDVEQQPCAQGINEYETQGLVMTLVVNQDNQAAIINPTCALVKPIEKVLKRQGLKLAYILDADASTKSQQERLSFINALDDEVYSDEHCNWPQCESLQFGNYTITRSGKDDYTYSISHGEMTDIIVSAKQQQDLPTNNVYLQSDELANLVNDNPAMMIIDTREPYEYEGEELASALGVAPKQIINIPVNRLLNAYSEGHIRKEADYLLLCRSGNRSGVALQKLLGYGFNNVRNIAGGVAELL